MAWRLAKSLLKMRDQINIYAPNRDKRSDGTIGDAAHASRKSDHNPWVKDGKTGVVTALDITHDPTNGVDTWKLAELLRVGRDPRIKYVISNSRIWSSTSSPYQWRRYTGSNPHKAHMHVSVHSTKSLYDDDRDWSVQTEFGAAPAEADADNPVKRPMLRRGSTGAEVREVQTVLGLPVDGIYGPKTETAVRKFQAQRKLVADGIVGADTWAKMDRIEQREGGERPGDMFEEQAEPQGEP